MAELKKVVHVMRRFVPGKWGGTESVVFNLSRALVHRGIKSVVFCTAMFSRAGLQGMEEVPVKRYRYVLPWFGLSPAAKDQLRLKGGSPLSLPLFFGLMREKEVSVIHAHVQHRLGGMARTAAKLKGIPLVVSLHGGHLTVPPDQTEKMIAPFRGKIEWGKIFGFLFGARRVLHDADAIICVGRNEYHEMTKRYPFKNIFHVPNGVRVERFVEARGQRFREAYGFQSSDKIVLCVSRIDYQKNQLGLVRAFSVFSKTHPEHRLVFVGTVTVAEYHRQVLTEIERLGLGDRVRMIDGIPPNDPLLPSAYKAAEQFVLPTHHEPFGIVILEAWAAGVPVVAHRVGGIPGFATDGENILLVAKDDEHELACRMAELADHVGLRRSLAEAARREVEASYNWETIARRYEEIYDQVTGSFAQG